MHVTSHTVKHCLADEKNASRLLRFFTDSMDTDSIKAQFMKPRVSELAIIVGLETAAWVP